MAIEITTQYLVLGGLLTNDYVYSKVVGDINESYFSDPSSAIIFKSFIDYYKQYKRQPSLIEMESQINKNYIPLGPTKQEVLNLAELLLSKGSDIDQDYLVDETSKFIKDVRTEKELTRFIEEYSSSGKVDMNKTAKKLAEASEFTISKSGVYKLSSSDDVQRARMNTIGDDSSKIINSVIPTINSSLTYNGLVSGTLSVVVSPPGCFTGDTKVMVKDSIMTFDEMYNLDRQDKPRVPTYDPEYGIVRDLTYESVYLSAYTKELYEIEFNGSEVIRCTPDHPFMTARGNYIEAQKLTNQTFIQAVCRLTDDEYTVIRKVATRIDKITLEEEVPVYGLVNVGDHQNYVVMTSSCEGVFVSNTGKTSYLINEGAYAAKQGFHVLNVFLGDMVEWDGFVRYASCISGEPQSTFINMSIDQITNFINSYDDGVLDRIDILAYAPSEITVDQLVGTIKNQQKDLGYQYDMVIIDYSDNFLTRGDSSYNEAGDVYDKLLLFARENRSVVFNASQPKIAYWKNEILGLDALADSSKKQHIADMIIGYNKPDRRSNVGSMFLSKVRRGTTGNLARVRTDFSRCRIYEIDENEYNNIRQTEISDY